MHLSIRADGAFRFAQYTLRFRLFYEQRRWRHFGYDPDAAAMQKIADLLARIRKAVGG